LKFSRAVIVQSINPSKQSQGITDLIIPSNLQQQTKSGDYQFNRSKQSSAANKGQGITN